MAPKISAQQVVDSRASGRLWLAVDGFVYDLTEFSPNHPGGPEVLWKLAGRDATRAYNAVHAPSLIKTLPAEGQLGVLDTSSMPLPSEWPPEHGKRGSVSLPPLHALVNTHDFEEAAALAFSPKAWAFLSSAATDLHTKRRNSAIYADIVLRPRLLRNVSTVSTRARMLGRSIPAPIFCSPTSLGRQFHSDGEKAIGRACARLGLPQCVSTSASFPLPEIVHEIRKVEAAAEGQDQTPGIPVFFQLYVDKDRGKSTKLLRESAALGISAIFLTIDAPVPGKREADERIMADESVSAPMTATSARNDGKGGALGRIMGGYIDASVTWRDISWIRQTCPGIPIVLKGIQTAADAMLAAESGVNAILLSNHGGRSLDTSPATICVLLELHKCCPQVFDQLEVYIDGGITRGTDIFKALCLGARAVGIGRGFVHGLAYGEDGIKKYIEILIDELETTMKNCGVTSLDQVHPDYVNTLAVDHMIPNSLGHPYARPISFSKHKL